MFPYKNSGFPREPFLPYPNQHQHMMGYGSYPYQTNDVMTQGQAPGNPFEMYTKPMFPQQNNMYTGTGMQSYFNNFGAAPKNVMGYFQDQNGQLDYDKMMKTVGQLAQTANQISPLVKGLGGFIKGIR